MKAFGCTASGTSTIGTFSLVGQLRTDLVMPGAANRRRSRVAGAVTGILSLLIGGLPGIVSPAFAEQVVVREPTSIEFTRDARLPGVSVAVVAGDPSNGPYTMRVRFAPDTEVPPHTHPDARTVTVLSGTYYFAVGERFDAAALRPYAAGTVIIVPAGVAHFVASRDGEVVLQESGVGPTGSSVVKPKP